MQLTRTQVVKAQHVANGAIISVWVLAGALWIASWFGSYITFAVGPEAAMTGAFAWPEWSWDIAGYALAYQAVQTVIQWGSMVMYRRTRASQWLVIYIGSLLSSAAPSFFTYWGWAGVALTNMIGNIYGAYGMLAGAVIAADRIPEKVFVDAGGE